MKKLLSAILAILMLFACAGGASAARPDEKQDEPTVKDGPIIALYPAELTLPIFSYSSGERLRVYYDGEPAPGDPFEWESSDSGVVTVDGSGNLTAVAPGTAVITVTDDEGETAEAVVTVVEDELFPTLESLEPIDLSLPFYSEEVGIGPLCGAEPVILKRFIRTPGCGGGPEPDPNDYIVTEGWTYSYAIIYRIRAHYGQSIRFVTSPSTADGQHASNAYLCLYDCNFYLWSYSGSAEEPVFGQVTLDSYEEGDFYLVITPGSHTDDAGSGLICLYAYDVTAPYAPGDVNMDHYVTASDALIVLRAALGISPIEGEGAPLADINGDGSISADDALVILRTAMGIGIK